MDHHRSMWKFLTRAIATNSIWSHKFFLEFCTQTIAAISCELYDQSWPTFGSCKGHLCYLGHKEIKEREKCHLHWFHSWPASQFRQAQCQQWVSAQFHTHKCASPAHFCQQPIRIHDSNNSMFLITDSRIKSTEACPARQVKQQMVSYRSDMTFSSSSATFFAISFFCSKTSSRSILGTLALTTVKKKATPIQWRLTLINSWIIFEKGESTTYSTKENKWMCDMVAALNHQTHMLWTVHGAWIACRRHLQQHQCVLCIALMPPVSQRHCPAPQIKSTPLTLFTIHVVIWF